MRKIAMIDVDGTLLKGNSYIRILMRHIDVPLACLAVQRLFGMLSAPAFSERAHRRLLPVLQDAAALGREVDVLEGMIDAGLLAFIKERLGGVEVLLVSASPHEWISELAQRLGVAGYGSCWIDGAYFHCKAANKLRLLRRERPPGEYEYFLSLTDNPEEQRLFGEFTHNHLWTGDMARLADVPAIPPIESRT